MDRYKEELATLKSQINKVQPKTNNNIFNQMAIDQAVILSKVSRIQADIDSINEKLEKDYVTQDQFDPVRKIVYGMVSVVLLAVMGGLVALVVKK